MDMAQLLKLGAQLFSESGTNAGHLAQDDIIGALASLLGGNADGSGIDLGSILESLNGAGLMELAQSWLGDGANAPISGEQLTQVFGQQKIDGFARQLGLQQADAEAGLTQAIPAILDSASSGGSLLELAGGPQGIMGMISKLFGKS
ncbi:YidB family protein [Ferrimonas balearica]|uniref:YidB family protein n=1 Tax=Ferrimonas balearica TaxID=44012 RepID=UPI001C98EDEF|nr:YidB family protein [Ferrimonas balearica]MBY5922014.1 DUF937 domain-containing protein [Ferrimonas balearica]MBY5994646.1 DUF937 domain-containing protein [Ferrimonas balearica]